MLESDKDHESKIDHVITYICQQNRDNPIVRQEFPLTKQRMQGLLSFIQVISMKDWGRKMFDPTVSEAKENIDPLEYYAFLEIVHGMCEEGLARRNLSPNERNLILDIMQALRKVETEDLLDMHDDDLLPDSKELWAYHEDEETLREYAKRVALVWDYNSKEWCIRVKPAPEESFSEWLEKNETERK